MSYVLLTVVDSFAIRFLCSKLSMADTYGVLHYQR
jgi:hypothetical protein